MVAHHLTYDVCHSQKPPKHSTFTGTKNTLTIILFIWQPRSFPHTTFRTATDYLTYPGYGLPWCTKYIAIGGG